MRVVVLAALGVLGVAFAVSPALAQLTDVRVNDNSTDGASFTQSETALAPKLGVIPSPLCVTFNDVVTPGARSEYGRSFDGGSTFADAGGFPIPTYPNGGYRGDPSVVFSRRDGRFYYVALMGQAQGVGGTFLWSSSSCDVAALSTEGSSAWYGSRGTGPTRS